MKDNKMTDKIYIDNSRFMELIDTLSTQITEIHYGLETYRDVGGVGKENMITFSDHANDYYNEKYDEYEMMFNTIANIYSDAR
jgi:hypothetical protein